MTNSFICPLHSQDCPLNESIEKLFDSKLESVGKLSAQSIFDLDKRCSLDKEALEKLVLQKIDDLDKRFELNSQQVLDRTNTVAQVLDRRLDAMNEFRLALSDAQKNFYSKTEHELFAKAIETDLRMLRESRAELAGAATSSQFYIALALALIGTITGVLAIVLKIITPLKL